MRGLLLDDIDFWLEDDSCLDMLRLLPRPLLTPFAGMLGLYEGIFLA